MSQSSRLFVVVANERKQAHDGAIAVQTLGNGSDGTSAAKTVAIANVKRRRTNSEKLLHGDDDSN